MNVASEPEQSTQFAFRVVEASGENNWYAAIVESRLPEAMAHEIAMAANDILPGSAEVERVHSAEVLTYKSTHQTWQVGSVEGYSSSLRIAHSRLRRVELV